jgi:hypothetical protein
MPGGYMDDKINSKDYGASSNHGSSNEWRLLFIINSVAIGFLIIFWPMSAYSGVFGPSNFWECILKEMPGVKNEVYARVVIKKCKNDYPNKYVFKESTLFGVRSFEDCVLKYAKDTINVFGSRAIGKACHELYYTEGELESINYKSSPATPAKSKPIINFNDIPCRKDVPDCNNIPEWAKEKDSPK